MMKQISSFLAFSLFACVTLTAQATYGVKAGIYAANAFSNKYDISLNGTDASQDRLQAETLIRPQFGLWANFQLNERFSLQPELLYTSKALLPKDVEGVEPLLFDYFSLPILINYQFSNWRAEFGPEISYLSKQYYKEEVGVFGNKNPLIDEQVVEIGFNAGIRYFFQQWSVGLRYQLDYTPFLSLALTDVNGTPVSGARIHQYHQGLQLSVGYSLVKK